MDDCGLHQELDLCSPFRSITPDFEGGHHLILNFSIICLFKMNLVNIEVQLAIEDEA